MIHKYLNNKGGFIFIVLVFVILGLGALGLALASSTVSNLLVHKSIVNADENYYGADGAMTYVQAVLERAGAYGRYNSKLAAEEAYELGLENEDPLTNDELIAVYNNTFKHYITSGRGRSYINEKLSDMQSNPVYYAKTEVLWNDIRYDALGIKLKINLKKIKTDERIDAEFLLAYNYILDEQVKITIPSNNPAPAGSMPIGFYNPLFRAALTTNSSFTLNDKASFYMDASETTGIALQWTLNNKTRLLSSNARVDIYGATIPALEQDGTANFQMNGDKLYVNGNQAIRTIESDRSNRIDLNKYYDPSFLNQIQTNKTYGSNSCFEAVDGDLILRVYKSDVNYPGDEWKQLSGKKGLIIIAGNINTNDNCNVNNFTGSMLILGNGTSLMNSSLKIIHNETYVKQAIELYKKTTDSDALNNLFKLSSLSQLSYDPEATVKSTISGGKLFNSPLTIGNNYVTAGGISSIEYPYIRLDNSDFSINDTAIGLQASRDKVQLVTQNNVKFYHNGNNIWNKGDDGLKNAVNIGDIFSYIDADSLKELKSSGITSLSRDNGNIVLKIYTGDVTIQNNGYIGNEKITGRKGLIFVNGRLSISGSFKFTGAVIATNGINAYNSGNIVIDYNMENTIDALNLSTSAVSMFRDGSLITSKTVSVYDNYIPNADNNDAYGAANSGSVNYERGVVILKWNSV